MITIVKSLDRVQRISSIRRRFAGLGISLLGNAAVLFAGLFTSVLAARIFGPAARGDLAAAVAWALIATAVADLGLSQAVPLMAARRIPGSGATAIAVAFGVSALLGPLFLAGHDILGYRLSGAAICYSLIGVPFGLAITYMAGIYQGLSRHGMFTAIRIFSVLPYAAGLALSIFEDEPSPDHVLWIALGLLILGCAGLCIFAALSSSLLERPGIAAAGTLLTYGLKAYPGNLAWAASQRVPMLLVGAGVFRGCAVIRGDPVGGRVGVRVPRARKSRV
jgi:O-antigen/teichoic acid export membrane protein